MAQKDWPTRPITMVVPFPPGGGNDTLARLVASKLSEGLGQQVVVDNRPGANGVIAMRSARKAAPDGYTVIFANTSATSFNLALNPHSGYDTLSDFEPVGMFASTGIGILAHPSFPANDVTGLIEVAKKQGQKLAIGTSPPGSGSHLSAELFKDRTGVDVTTVPYKGAAALTSDLLGGHIPVIFSVVPPALGAIEAGKLKLLAMTGTERISRLPNVPTVSETIPGFEAVLRYGLLVPKGTPEPIVERFSAVLRKAAMSDDMKKRLGEEASSPISSTAAEYAAQIKQEDALWAPLIKSLGIQIKK